MKTLEILKNHTSEIVEKTLALLPNAFRGDTVNRMFFVVEGDGEIVVDYMVNLGLPITDDNIFFVIKSTETVDPEEYGCDDLDDVDFQGWGWEEKIRGSISMKIESLEMFED